MSSKVLSECPMEVFGHCGPFDDELMTDIPAAISRLQSLSPLNAVRLVLAVYRRNDAVIDDREIDDLAEALGVFADNED